MRHPIRGLLVAVAVILVVQPLVLVSPAQEAAPLTTSPCTGLASIPESECLALVALYESTGGSAWKVRTNWLTAADPCQWFGVTCGTVDLEARLATEESPDGPLHVVRLELPENELLGTIPADIGGLPYLWKLRLSGNRLSGAIPAELGGLSILREV